MSTHPRVVEATAAAIERYGTGCAGSRFLNGSLDLHTDLEQRLADLLHKEAAILFPSGYQANIGSVAALIRKNDVAVFDAYCAPSVGDGGQLALGRVHTYQHQNIPDLEAILELTRHHDQLVVVDGIFQPEGDTVDLPSVSELCRTLGAGLMVNDAYGIGIKGPGGSGTVQSFGLNERVNLITGSLGKALGAAGGFAAGDAAVIEYLKHHARSLIFSASLAPPSAAAALAALDVLQQEPERLQRLRTNVRYFAEALREFGYDCGDGESPSIPVYFNSARASLRKWRRLLDAGVLAIRLSNTESRCAGGMIRVSIMAGHTIGQLNCALEVFAEQTA